METTDVTCDYKCMTCERFSTGICKSCSPGYWGTFCEHVCFNCKNDVCNRNTGECLIGCIDGYGVNNCSTSIHNDDVGNNDAVNVLWVCVGMVAGLAVILIVFIVRFKLYMKRKRLQQNRTRMSDCPESSRATQFEGDENEYITRPDTSTSPTEQFMLEQRLPPDPLQTNQDVNALQKDANVTSLVHWDRFYNTVGLNDLAKRQIVVDKLEAVVMTMKSRDFISEFEQLSRTDENEINNKFLGTFPNDVTRIFLHEGITKINANFIDGYKKKRAFIAFKGPFVKYVDEFWEMVWQKRCSKIVVLVGTKEAQDDTCWQAMEFSGLYDKISVTCQHENNYAYYTVKTLIIQLNTEYRQVTYFVFTAWPEGGLPDVKDLVEFRNNVNKTKSELVGPVLIHSFNTDHTAMYIALDKLTQEGEAEGYVDIFSCVRQMQEQRVTIIHSAEQYEYLHHALVHSLRRYAEVADVEQIQRDHSPMCYTEVADVAQIQPDHSPRRYTEVADVAQIHRDHSPRRYIEVADSAEKQRDHSPRRYIEVVNVAQIQRDHSPRRYNDVADFAEIQHYHSPRRYSEVADVAQIQPDHSPMCYTEVADVAQIQPDHSPRRYTEVADVAQIHRDHSPRRYTKVADIAQRQRDHSPRRYSEVADVAQKIQRDHSPRSFSEVAQIQCNKVLYEEYYIDNAAYITPV